MGWIPAAGGIPLILGNLSLDFSPQCKKKSKIILEKYLECSAGAQEASNPGTATWFCVLVMQGGERAKNYIKKEF